MYSTKQHIDLMMQLNFQTLGGDKPLDFVQ